MTVSVIVPNYCHAAYLPQRIDSILQQTYTDYELILLDDASPDHSREVLESYRNHPQVTHLVLNERNSGSPFAQWQRGFELAQGRYIWIAESDDYADPHLLERCVACLDADPRCVLAHTDGLFVDAEGAELSRRRPVRPAESMEGTRFAVERLLSVNTLYNASMAVFRRDARPDPQEYAGYRYNGDLIFWILVALKGRVCTVHEQLNYFRQHQTNTTGVSARSGGMYAEMLPILTKVFHIIPIGPGRRYALVGKFLSRLRRDARRAGWNAAYRQLWTTWCERFGHPYRHIGWSRLRRLFTSH